MLSLLLVIYDPKAETQLHCDASSCGFGSGFGSILMQKQNDGRFHPVFYYSKKTSVSESKMVSFELELLCIVYALKRFRIYLHGLEFTIITDCNSVTLALQKKDINTRILRWYMELQQYNYLIQHRSGQLMQHVDSLSRHSILVVEENSFERTLCLKQSQHK